MNRLVSALVVLFGCSTLCFSQSTQNCDPSKDARIEKGKPSVYISFERFAKAINPLETRMIEPSGTGKSKEKGNDVWLRLHNNTCWPIQLTTLSSYLPKERKPNEKLIDYLKRGLYLENDSEISLFYVVEEKDGRRVRSFIDSFFSSRLPAGVSVLFSVAREDLSIAKERSIFVSYNYPWEIDERGFDRADEPEHRVEYRSYELRAELKN